jgi:hypothetical protein
MVTNQLGQSHAICKGNLLCTCAVHFGLHMNCNIGYLVTGHGVNSNIIYEKEILFKFFIFFAKLKE